MNQRFWHMHAHEYVFCSGTPSKMVVFVSVPSTKDRRTLEVGLNFLQGKA